MVAPGNYVRTLDPSRCLSASMRTGRFGYATGSIETTEFVEMGEIVKVSIGEASVSGIVAGITLDQSTSSRVLELLDPATATFDVAPLGAGPLIDQLDYALYKTGASVNMWEWEFEQKTILPYPPDEPVPWAEWIRMACITLGIDLVFRDGEYIVFGGDLLPTVPITTAEAIGSAVTSDPTPYANVVVVSVDDEWTEPALDLTETVESIGGLVTTTRKWGDQVVYIKQDDNETGQETIEEWMYNDQGYCTRYEKTERTPDPDGSTGTKREVITTYTVTDDENVYSYESLDRTKEWTWWVDDPTDTPEWGWATSSEKSVSASVNLKGLSVITSIEREVENRTAVHWDLRDTRKTETRIFRKENDSGAATERSITRTWTKQPYLNGSEDETAWRWVTSGSSVGGGESIEDLIMSPKEKTHSVHLETTVRDSDTVDAVGEVRKEIKTVCLNDIKDLEDYGIGELRESALIRTIQLSMPKTGELIPGRRIEWNGENWIVNAVEISLGDGTEILEAVATPSLEALRPILLGRPDLASSILRAIRNHGRTITNVQRGTVIGRIGQDSFTVQTGLGVVRANRGYLTSGPVAIGETVLMAKPSGKERKWTMLARPRERGVERSGFGISVLGETPPYAIVSPESSADGNGVVSVKWDERGGYAKVSVYEFSVVEQLMYGGTGSREYGEQKIIWEPDEPSEGTRSFSFNSPTLPGAEFSISVEALNSDTTLGRADLGSILNISAPVFKARNDEYPVNVTNECELQFYDVFDLVLTCHKDLYASITLSGYDPSVVLPKLVLDDSPYYETSRIIVNRDHGSQIWAKTKVNEDGDFEFEEPDDALPTGLSNRFEILGGVDPYVGLPARNALLTKAGEITPVISDIPGVPDLQGTPFSVVEVPDLEFSIPQDGPFTVGEFSGPWRYLTRYDISSPYCLRSNSLGFTFSGTFPVQRICSIFHLIGTPEYNRFVGENYRTYSIIEGIPTLLFCNRLLISVGYHAGDYEMNGDPPTSATFSDMFYQVKISPRYYLYDDAESDWGFSRGEFPGITFPEQAFQISVPVHQETDPSTEEEINLLSDVIVNRPIVVSCLPQEGDIETTDLFVSIAGKEMSVTFPTRYLWSGLDIRSARSKYDDGAVVRVEKPVHFNNDGTDFLQLDTVAEQRARALWGMSLMPPAESMVWGSGTVYSPYKESVQIPPFVIDPDV